MTFPQLQEIYRESRPEMNRVFQYAQVTGDFGPICRLLTCWNEALIVCGQPAVDYSDLPFYRDYTYPQKPTIH